MSTSEMKWMLDVDGERRGPVGGRELAAMVTDSKLPAGTKVRTVGTEEWHLLSEVKESLLMLARRSIDDLCETVGQRAKVLVDRLRKLFKRAEELGVASLEGGVPGEEYFFYAGPFLVDIDGSLTVDEDWAQDSEAAAPSSTRAFAKRLAEVPAFQDVPHLDFIGGHRLRAKLGDISENHFRKLLELLG